MNDFAEMRENLHTTPAPWLDELRSAGIAHFNEVGFPNPREEAWRFTNLAPIRNTEFKLAHGTITPGARAAARRASFGDDAAVELVFINGHFARELSKLADLPRGAAAISLADAIDARDPAVERHLARIVKPQHTPFTALTTGLLLDGACVRLPRGTSIPGTIHLLFVSTGGSEPTVSHPRVLIVAEDNVEAAIVESYVGVDGAVYWTNAVTEVLIGKDCRIDHNKLQQESLAAYHTAAMHVELGRSSYFISHNTTLGGKITRNDPSVRMAGEYAYAVLNGLVVIGGEQHCDNHTLLEHSSPNCPSHELYKHVLDGKSMAVFKGQIYVAPGAQKTDSKQTSKALLLSDDANMHSQPALEIYADDVKCTHGSTTGPVDQDMLFYLRSRGVGHDAARHLLTYAFAADVTRRITIEPVRARIEDFMAAQHGLPQDLRITDLGAFDAEVL
jgi:Fe-S cluster assembly protein SufD